jgi:hypothetical protein
MQELGACAPFGWMDGRQVTWHKAALGADPKPFTLSLAFHNILTHRNITLINANGKRSKILFFSKMVIWV